MWNMLDMLILMLFSCDYGSLEDSMQSIGLKSACNQVQDIELNLCPIYTLLCIVVYFVMLYMPYES